MPDDPQVALGSAALFRVDPLTGHQSIVSSNDLLVFPFGPDFASNGDLFIPDLSGIGELRGVIRIDPFNGIQSVVSSDGLLVQPTGLAVLDVLSVSSAIPEPSTLTLLSFGALGLLGYGWRRRRITRLST